MKNSMPAGRSEELFWVQKHIRMSEHEKVVINTIHVGAKVIALVLGIGHRIAYSGAPHCKRSVSP